MKQNVTQKLIEAHLVRGSLTPGAEIALRIDQTLTQDATGTLVMLELEAMGVGRVRTEVSAQYVDHNLLQVDHRNADDHLFLQSACQRFGVWYSRPGNGVSHPVHMQRFGEPGKTLLGADSHTCAAGAMAMLAMGAGGLEVALAMAGEPFHLRMPEVMGIRLEGRLPDWVSAKDVILEILRRHGVRGGVGKVLEYHGPGLAELSAWDRHVIANMGAELGATTSVFPADEVLRGFLEREGRGAAFWELRADEGAAYDREDVVDLSSLEPLIAKPSSPGRVVPVREVAGAPIYQAYLGSSANPGPRDFAVPAMMVAGRQIAPGVSFDVNPATRGLLEDLARAGFLEALIASGARIHQAGCNGCIGMGQAPATERNSLRTVPRNFPGRSGTREDKVWLVSPETATASALTGVITDPRSLKIPYPRYTPIERPDVNTAMLQAPPPPEESRRVELVKGPNITSLPEMEALPDRMKLPVLLKVGDDVSTDEIMPAGARVLPYRSNIQAISQFAFDVIDPTYPERALAQREHGGHCVVGGENYGQGSSREHAALAPRFLGLAVVIAKSFARIHHQNLVNFGILPLVFTEPADYDRIHPSRPVRFTHLHAALRGEAELTAALEEGEAIRLTHNLSPRQLEVVLQGGIINWQQGRSGSTRHLVRDEARPSP